MKILIILIASLMFGIPGQTGQGKSGIGNDTARISIAFKQDTMAPGDSGLILINFKPEENYFINMEPVPYVKLDSNKIIASIGKIKPEMSKKPEYIDASRPVKLPITVRKDVKSGKYEIKGTLTYFICSGTDGLCSKFKHPFSLKITIR